jgi:hypothetical protein
VKANRALLNVLGVHGIEPVIEGHKFPFFNRQNSDIFEVQALLAHSTILLQLLDRPPESVRQHYSFFFFGRNKVC